MPKYSDFIIQGGGSTVFFARILAATHANALRAGPPNDWHTVGGRTIQDAEFRRRQWYHLYAWEEVLPNPDNSIIEWERGGRNSFKYMRGDAVGSIVRYRSVGTPLVDESLHHEYFRGPQGIYGDDVEPVGYDGEGLYGVDSGWTGEGLPPNINGADGLDIFGGNLAYNSAEHNRWHNPASSVGTIVMMQELQTPAGIRYVFCAPETRSAVLAKITRAWPIGPAMPNVNPEDEPEHRMWAYEWREVEFNWQPGVEGQHLQSYDNQFGPVGGSNLGVRDRDSQGNYGHQRNYVLGANINPNDVYTQFTTIPGENFEAPAGETPQDLYWTDVKFVQQPPPYGSGVFFNAEWIQSQTGLDYPITDEWDYRRSEEAPIANSAVDTWVSTRLATKGVTGFGECLDLVREIGLYPDNIVGGTSAAINPGPAGFEGVTFSHRGSTSEISWGQAMSYITGYQDVFQHPNPDPVEYAPSTIYEEGLPVAQPYELWYKKTFPRTNPISLNTCEFLNVSPDNEYVDTGIREPETGEPRLVPRWVAPGVDMTKVPRFMRVQPIRPGTVVMMHFPSTSFYATPDITYPQEHALGGLPMPLNNPPGKYPPMFTCPNALDAMDDPCAYKQLPFVFDPKKFRGLSGDVINTVGPPVGV